ncbi:CLUMA_CG020158, isoform A [Clunio marinus]|uniref:CLUMA_CG020158, isoform A n=1 Tax=Clunio marinus TaxID=568069 RepID=A0A1J1J5D7_9DIPT|nr:CLUMA_CG020158, isoform A [Clunio marinus]
MRRTMLCYSNQRKNIGYYYILLSDVLGQDKSGLIFKVSLSKHLTRLCPIENNMEFEPELENLAKIS